MRTSHRSKLTTYLLNFSLLVLFLVVVPSSRPALAFAENNAIDHIQSLGDSALATLAQDNLTTLQHGAELAEMLREKFDIPFIARYVMGRFWRKAAEKQRKEYVKLFENFVVKVYSRYLISLKGATFVSERTEPIGKKQDILVATVITQVNGQILKLSWRVRPVNGHPKIVDVTTEGISMIVTKRGEFASILREGGILGLIAFLRSKLAPQSPSS